MLGTRLQVFRGKRTRTSGGLKKVDLVKNKFGKIVSKKKQVKAKKKSNLGKYLVSKARPVARPVAKPTVRKPVAKPVARKPVKPKPDLTKYREQHKQRIAKEREKAKTIDARKKAIRRLRAKQKKRVVAKTRILPSNIRSRR